MRNEFMNSPVATILRNIHYLLFVLVLVVFALLSPNFLKGQNLLQIVVQSSSVGIVAVGMTFVLLTAGIDLSVGAIMLVAAAVAGKMVLSGQPVWLACLTMVGVGTLYGLINGLCVTRLKLMPFIVTLATLWIGRGFGLWITETRAMNLPESFTQLGSSKFLGLPFPVVFLIVTAVVGHLILTQTPFGRQIYAVGADAEAARKSGLNSSRILLMVYGISGLCAGIGGLVSLAQLGAVSPRFGLDREFAAVAAAVLGGTSLFGGRGHILPGTLLGALLIQTVENGLNLMNANVYIYPLVTSSIIFTAVLLDSLRHRYAQKISARKIRLET